MPKSNRPCDRKYAQAKDPNYNPLNLTPEFWDRWKKIQKAKNLDNKERMRERRRMNGPVVTTEILAEVMRKVVVDQFAEVEPSPKFIRWIKLKNIKIVLREKHGKHTVNENILDGMPR